MRWLLLLALAPALCTKGVAGKDAGAGGGVVNGIRFGLQTLMDMVSPRLHHHTSPTSIKVFVAGFGRTGTGSLALALSELGYKSCWGPAMFQFADDINDMTSGNISGEQLLATIAARGYNATGLDAFGWNLYREAALLPGVKMIMTVRDADAWAESVATTVGLHFDYFASAPFKL